MNYEKTNYRSNSRKNQTFRIERNTRNHIKVLKNEIKQQFLHRTNRDDK